MKARDLMTADPTTCRPTDNLKDIVGVMRDEDCGIVPITEGNEKAIDSAMAHAGLVH